MVFLNVLTRRFQQHSLVDSSCFYKKYVFRVTVGDLFDKAVDKTLNDKEFMQFAKDRKM